MFTEPCPSCLSLITKDPLAVLERSLRNGLTRLTEPAARASLSTPIETVFDRLPSHYFVPWVAFYPTN